MARRRIVSPGLSNPAREPNAKIAELYGHAPNLYRDLSAGQILARKCPIRNSICDVTANRHQVAHLGLNHKGVHPDEAAEIRSIYGDNPLPLGICSCWTRRQNETEAKPWILCPKRLLTLEPPKPVIPQEVRRLIQITDGTRVGVWSELKLRHRERESSGNRFFEYTFDYLLMGLDDKGNPTGAPYIIEVMTSSTRGGGLTEHMVDVLLGRDQRYLGGGVVDSVYTPNYRQIFERMLGQFIAKSEIAERWGGRTIWVFQDVLLDYIEQTTAFDSSKLTDSNVGNVFAEVYRLEAPSPDEISDRSGLHLAHHKSLRGRARLNEHSADYTSFLGLGYAPTFEELIKTLRAGMQGSRAANPRLEKTNSISPIHANRWFDFILGDDIDPREGEIFIL